MKTLLVGATGLLGPEICQRLMSAGHQVRALVRSTADAGKRAALHALGVELVEGDLKDTASLARAWGGVQAVISTASSTLSRQGGQARRRKSAEVVRNAYTVIQASYFMEVWLTPALGFDAANGKVRLYGDGSQPISWISYKDVARAAAAAIIEGTGRHMVVELGGPQALSPHEVVRMFETAGVGEITTESVPVTVLEGQLKGSTDSLQQSFAGLMLQYAAGDAIDTTTSSRLFPFQMTSVRDFITTQLAAARG